MLVVEESSMAGRLVRILATAAVLLCPHLCRSGPGCCATAECVEAAPPACCAHCQVPETPEPVAPVERECDASCFCAGALAERAGYEPCEPVVAEGCWPVAATSPMTATAHVAAAAAFDFAPVLSGRDSRIARCSWVC